MEKAYKVRWVVMTALLMLLMLPMLPLTAADEPDWEDSLFGETANDSPSLVSDEELFGGSSGSDLFEDDVFADSPALVSEVVETEKNLQTSLLGNEADKVRIGGSFNFELTPGWKWLVDSDTDAGTLVMDLGSKLFVDARPSTDTRIFAKAVISYPFVENGTSRTFSDIVSIRELFSDFNIQDKAFFRVGKQTINWGVGYFFSPADLLNLSEINPLDPDEELEGPVSMRMNMPIGLDNLYTYVIVPEDATDATDLALAGKYEKVLGAAELGLGAYYRNGQSPAVMATLSTSIGKVAVFGEAMLKYGSDKTFVVADGGSGYTTTTYDDRLFFSGTIGGSYSWSDDESDFGYTLIGQYYYNGEGYDNTDFYTSVPSYLLSGDLTVSDIMSPGRHYGAVLVSATFTDTLSANVMWYGNMSDFSGLVQPSLTWSPTDEVAVSLGLACTYGKAGSEFTLAFPNFTSNNRYIAATLGFTLGASSF